MRFEAHAEMTPRERAAVRLALEHIARAGRPRPPAWSMATREATVRREANAGRPGGRAAWQAARDRGTWPDRPWRPEHGRPAMW